MKQVRPAAVAAASVLLFSTATALAAPAPPDLDGQSWRASVDVAPTHGTPGAPGDVVTTTERTCDVFGNATLTMTASGIADGPYQGTFHEEITVALGPVKPPSFDRDVETNVETASGLVVTSGTFSIDSPVGQVEGTLLFDRAQTPAIGDPSRSGATGWCLNEPEFPGSATVTPVTDVGGAMTAYEATITTPDGCVFVDHGGDSDPSDDSVIAGGFEMRSSPFPQGSTVAQGFQSDGAPLEASPGCEPTSTIDGFFPPVDNLPVVNEVNAGRAIPIKFSLGGDHGLDIFAAGYPRSEQVGCSTLVDEVEETTTADSSSITYDAASDRYHYVWKTEQQWSGDCRQFVVRLNDGTEKRATFRFR